MKPCAALVALVSCALLLQQAEARAAGPAPTSHASPAAESTPWHQGIEEIAERLECPRALPFFESSGADWGATPEHRPGLLYMWAALRDRCMTDGAAWTQADDDLAKRLGAPFDLRRFEDLISQFPPAMRHLSRLWRFFSDTRTERRIDVIDRHLAAFVARARGIDHCGHADGGDCERAIVHARLTELSERLTGAVPAGERDERAIRSFHLALLAAADSATLRVVFGDVIDQTGPKPAPAASRHPGSRSSTDRAPRSAGRRSPPTSSPGY